MTDTYSPDRHSIVTFLSNLAGSFDKGPERDLVYTLVTQIQRGDDITPAKPKATIADILALHDLDLGALAHVAGVIGDDLDDGDVRALCEKYQSVNDWHELVAGVLPSSAATFAARQFSALAARQFSALGAKVRAALSAPTIKVATPRVLQSADEAPCGALIKDVSDGNYTLRLVDGRGFHVRRYSGAGVDSLPVRGGGAWLWAGSIRNIRGAVEVIAEGLTEAECRHLSGLSAADALAWCKARDKACATHDAAVIDRLQRDGDSLRSLLAVIRHALGAGDHNDIVKHARAIKARADRA